MCVVLLVFGECGREQESALVEVEAVARRVRGELRAQEREPLRFVRDAGGAVERVRRGARGHGRQRGGGGRGGPGERERPECRRARARRRRGRVLREVGNTGGGSIVRRGHEELVVGGRERGRHLRGETVPRRAVRALPAVQLEQVQIVPLQESLQPACTVK